MYGVVVVAVSFGLHRFGYSTDKFDDDDDEEDEYGSLILAMCGCGGVGGSKVRPNETSCCLRARIELTSIGFMLFSVSINSL